MFRILVFIFAFCAAIPCLAGSKPMPSKTALRAAKELITDTFRKELSASDKTPAVKAMLDTADKTERDAEKAALYLSAADVATRAGEAKLAFEALERLAVSFDVDLLALKLAAIESVANEARSTDARVSVVNRGLELANDAEKDGRFEVAESALKTAAAASSRVRDAALRRTVGVKRREMERAKRQYEREHALIDAVRKTLKEKPDDPDANETLGKYLAFDKNDWAAGLKHLAKASDPDVQKAALADQSGATVASQATTLGDWWWALGDGADDERDKFGYRSRAAFWYSRAVPELTGLSKTRIERRLQEAGEEAIAAAAEQTGNDKYVDITLAPGVFLRLVKIPASADGKIKEFYLGQTEVTQKQWQTVMGSNPSGQKRGDSLPVHNVRFKTAQEFCAVLNNMESRSVVFRLPAKDEWFHALEADEPDWLRSFRFPASGSYAWTKENAGGRYDFHPVASLKPNAWGLYDMVGNCWEWLADGADYGLSSWNDCTPQSVETFLIGRRPSVHAKEKDWGVITTLRVAAERR